MRAGLLFVAIALAGGFLSCATAPGATSSWEIRSNKQRGAFLDVHMTQGSQDVRFFFPAGSEECQRVLTVGSNVEYVVTGPLGRVRSAAGQCDPAGIGSLDWWRRRRGRPNAPPSPRSTARFQTIYTDEEFAMVRGRIPFTGLVNFAGGEDAIAVLPMDSACRPLLDIGEASIEFRAAGPIPLRMIHNGQICPIQGLIRP